MLNQTLMTTPQYHDLTFPLARSMIISGPSCAGKSTFVCQLLEHAHEYFTPPPKHVLWFFGGVPPHPLLPHVQYRKGLPTEKDVKSMHECIVVLDDLMWEARSSDLVGNLFTRVAHHQSCFVIQMTQNLFQGGKVTRSQSLNAHYFVLMKNPRDRAQILYLARQIYPRKEDYVLASFEDATREPYGYLLVDLNSTTPDHLRLRTNIFDKQIVVYMDPNHD